MRSWLMRLGNTAALQGGVLEADANCRLLLIRHGETDWNREQRYQGRADVPINAQGRKQIARVAEFLSDEVIERIFTTPLQRALESAEIFALHHTIKPRILKGFSEMDLGDWEGQSYEITTGYPDWLSSAPHGGESEQQFLHRIRGQLEKLQLNGTIVLVIHGLVIQALLAHFLKQSFADWHAKPVLNGAVTELHWNKESWNLKRFNQLPA